MTAKKMIPIGIAVLLGLVAVLLVRSYLTAATASASTALRPVVVASVPLSRGASTAAGMLKVVQFPADSIPSGAYTTIAEISGPNARLTLRPIAANEPILAAKLAPVGSAPVMSMNVRPGMRAISVKSDEVVGVGGFLVPGDKVDVLVTRTIGTGANPPTVVQSLAENVVVLGVDQIDETDKPLVAKAITLEVTALQAQSISLAKAVGTITLALRQGSDMTTFDRKMLSAADLGPGLPVAPPTVVAPAPRPKAASRAPAGTNRAPPIGPQIVVTRGTSIASYNLAQD